jgi:beta-glucosidase
MFLDPIVGKGYPQRHLAAYPEVAMPIEDGDMELLATPFDFLGINYYHERVVGADPSHPEGFRSVPMYHPTTDMGWPIVPVGLTRLLRWVSRACPELPLYVTENGCAMPDQLSQDGRRCHDPGRVDYLRSHFAACRTAIEDGVDLRGYFLWSFIDNFEWAYGYTKRFGIVYCDYINQRRVAKDSYYYYREVIAGHEL